MLRRSFDRELRKLQDEVLVLGDMVDEAIRQSVEILKRRDAEGAKALIANDKRINEKRFAIEEACLQLIATQQPMARDLRTIAATLEIITDLERMADHAAGIAKITILIGDEPLIKPLIDVPRMAEKGRSMLRRALEAFINQDAEAAARIAAEDDEVDALYNQVVRELFVLMMENPHNIRQANYLTWVSHNLERIADRVTNICERVVFLVTGRMEEVQ